MNDLVMMRAALFNLSAALEGIEDSFLQSQIRLATTVLSGAVDNAESGLNPAIVSDIEFALNDLVGTAGELSGPDAALVEPFIDQLRHDVEQMKSAGTLSRDVVAAIQSLQAKLRTRRKGIERQTFVEGASEADLPHPPEVLRAEALPIREHLAANGFATPALDELIADPQSLRMHGIIAIIDELEVIAG